MVAILNFEFPSAGCNPPALAGLLQQLDLAVRRGDGSVGVRSDTEAVWAAAPVGAGVLCASSGTVTDEMIEAYIEGHTTGPAHPDFQVEVPE